MDTAKFKIKLLSVLFLCSALYCYGQYEIPIYVTTTAADSSIAMGIVPNTGVDFRYVKTDTVYRYGYGGYNNLIAGNDVFPIHLEDYDDFNAAAFRNDSITTIVYSGAQGALKNEFLFSRNKAFTKFSNTPNLLEQSNDVFNSSLDSILKNWNTRLETMPFSPIFKADEAMFYKSYEAYLKMIHKQYGIDQTINLNKASLADFPKIDFNNERYYTTIATYKVMAHAYHFKKIIEMEKVRDARRYLNNLNGFYLVDYLKTKAFLLATEHHPRAEFLYNISSPRFEPHPSTKRRAYRKSRKTGAGIEFDYPELTSIDGTIVDFTRFKGKDVYLYIYHFSDPNLGQNLRIWNKFALSNGTNTYYIAYAIDGSLNSEMWRKLQFEGNIAGLNVKSNLKESSDFLEGLGIRLLPRIVHIGEDGTVQDPNLDLNFNKKL